MKKSLSILARCLCLALAAWLIWRLVHRADQDVLSSFRQCLASPQGITAIALYFIVQLLGAWRWQLLLSAPGMPIPYLQCLRLTLGGDFFSLVIPGGISGDIIKVGAATAIHPGKAAELTLVDLLDRAIGLAGLFGAGGLAVLFLHRLLLAQEASAPTLTFAVVVVFSGLICALTGYLLWAKWPTLKTRAGIPKITALLSRMTPDFGKRLFGRFGDALSLYRERRAVLWETFGISVAIHLLLGVEFFFLGKALHESQMTLPQYLLTTQLANASAILPITPGGLGIRDTIAEVLFQNFGAEPAVVATTIPLLYSAILVFWGLVGAIAFAIIPPPKTISLPETQQGIPK